MTISVVLNGKTVDVFPSAASKPGPNLFRDEALTQPLDPSQTLAEQGLEEGDVVYKKPGFGFPEAPEDKLLHDK